MEIDKVAKYVTDVLRTEPDDYHDVCGRLTNHPNLIRMLHASLGMVTETGELIDNLHGTSTDFSTEIEELGDAMWYAAILAHETQMPYEQWDIPLDDDSIWNSMIQANRNILSCYLLNMTRSSSRICDYVKKRVFYGKNIPEDDLNRELVVFIHIVRLYCYKIGVSFEDVLQKNIAKLRTRYPDKYSDQAAINRDLVAEHSALES